MKRITKTMLMIVLWCFFGIILLSVPINPNPKVYWLFVAAQAASWIFMAIQDVEG